MCKKRSTEYGHTMKVSRERFTDAKVHFMDHLSVSFHLHAIYDKYNLVRKKTKQNICSVLENEKEINVFFSMKGN